MKIWHEKDSCQKLLHVIRTFYIESDNQTYAEKNNFLAWLTSVVP